MPKITGGRPPPELVDLLLPDPRRKVTAIRLSLADRHVVVVAGYKAGIQFACPTCGKPCGVYDHRKRQWHHLDTCQLQTLIEAEVPRVSFPQHGVQQVVVPWAEPGGRFTALFEAMVIAGLGEAPTAA